MYTPNNRLELTILYVEDDETTRLECEQILKRRVTTVLLAEDGKAGLELFRQHRPDLVVTDIRMPIMDGLQMSNAIRELAPEARIIATTAHNDTPYLLEAIEIGIDHYVLKPIDVTKFSAIIGKCCRSIIAQKAVQRYHAEREKMIGELTSAMDEIKTLQGILPICSYCKNIRNDAGYWEQVETYISRHSMAEFSHEVCCPSCLQKHSPDRYANILDKDSQEE